jgi:hypothetical protein
MARSRENFILRSEVKRVDFPYAVTKRMLFAYFLGAEMKTAMSGKELCMSFKYIDVQNGRYDLSTSGVLMMPALTCHSTLIAVLLLFKLIVKFKVVPFHSTC